MKVAINSKCIGCTVCTCLAESVFEMNGEKAVPKKNPDLTTKEVRENVEAARKACPVEAIIVTENTER